MPLSDEAVLATAKVPNLKANHNKKRQHRESPTAVLATAKVPNLKANHNNTHVYLGKLSAVLATAKIPNLSANHKDHFPLPLGGDALTFGGRAQEDI